MFETLQCPDWFLHLTPHQKEHVVGIIGDANQVTEDLINKISEETGEDTHDCKMLLQWCIHGERIEDEDEVKKLIFFNTG